MDDGNDGGARDAKWGWFHPSRMDTDVVNTWATPSFFGHRESGLGVLGTDERLVLLDN